MRSGRVVASVILKVVVGRSGERRFVLHDLLSREVRSFATWEEAVAYLGQAAAPGGLR